MLFALSYCAAGLAQSAAKPVDFPACAPVRISSPDQRWILVTEDLGMGCPNNRPAVPRAKPAQTLAEANDIHLFLEDRVSQHRWPIALDGWGGSAGWSPSGQAFFINESISSNEAEAALYRLHPGTLQTEEASVLEKIDMRSRILRLDPKLRRLTGDHDYFFVRKWIDPQTVLVQFCGHAPDTSRLIHPFGDRRTAHPAASFNSFYQIRLDGQITRQKSAFCSPDKQDCECGWKDIQ